MSTTSSGKTPDSIKTIGNNAHSPSAPHRLRWRVVDIAVASVIGVASGIIFWAVGVLPFYDALEAVVPGLSGLINGLWVFAAPLALFIVRKPGSGLYAELLACFVEMILGSQWSGIDDLIPAVLQGVAAEIVFAVLPPTNSGHGGRPSSPAPSPRWARGCTSCSTSFLPSRRAAGTTSCSSSRRRSRAP